MKKYITETQSIILKIYVINFPIYIIKFPVNCNHRWCSLNKIFLNSLQYSHLCWRLFLINLLPPDLLLKRDSNAGVFLWILQTLTTPISRKHLRRASSDSSYILHRSLNKIIQEADWPSRLSFCFFWNIKSLYFTYSHSYSFVWSLAVIRCYSLLFFVTRCHLLPFIVTCCTTGCHSFYPSLSFVVPLDVIRCHSLSFNVTRCTTRLYFYKQSLFYIFLLFTSFIVKTKTKKILSLKF